MTAGNYYDQGNVKLLLDIAQDDTVDDETLDALGESANKEIDNFLATMQKDVPPNTITNDLKMAANYKVIALYKARKNDYDGAKYWNQLYSDIKTAIMDSIANNVLDGSTIVADRF